MSLKQSHRTLSRRVGYNKLPQILPINRRSYAQAAAVQDTKPPVALFGLDGTYASALVVHSL